MPSCDNCETLKQDYKDLELDFKDYKGEINRNQ